MGGCVVTNPNKEPTMATKSRPRREGRLLEIHGCYRCWHKTYDSCVCDKTGRVVPITGIPAWCPLPVAKPSKPANTKPRRAKL